MTFSFPESVWACTNKFILLIPSWDKANFSFVTWVATPVFDQSHTNIFQSTFNFHESKPKCKKSGNFIILRYVWSKNLAIWLVKSILFPISAVWQMTYTLIIDQNQHKLMIKISNEFKKPYFWSIFPFLWGTKKCVSVSKIVPKFWKKLMTQF